MSYTLHARCANVNTVRHVDDTKKMKTNFKKEHKSCNFTMLRRQNPRDDLNDFCSIASSYKLHQLCGIRSRSALGLLAGGYPKKPSP